MNLMPLPEFLLEPLLDEGEGEGNTVPCSVA